MRNNSTLGENQERNSLRKSSQTNQEGQSNKISKFFTKILDIILNALGSLRKKAWKVLKQPPKLLKKTLELLLKAAGKYLLKPLKNLIIGTWKLFKKPFDHFSKESRVARRKTEERENALQSFKRDNKDIIENAIDQLYLKRKKRDDKSKNHEKDIDLEANNADNENKKTRFSELVEVHEDNTQNDKKKDAPISSGIKSILQNPISRTKDQGSDLKVSNTDNENKNFSFSKVVQVIEDKTPMDIDSILSHVFHNVTDEELEFFNANARTYLENLPALPEMLRENPFYNPNRNQNSWKASQLDDFDQLTEIAKCDLLQITGADFLKLNLQGRLALFDISKEVYDSLDESIQLKIGHHDIKQIQELKTRSTPIETKIDPTEFKQLEDELEEMTGTRKKLRTEKEKGNPDTDGATMKKLEEDIQKLESEITKNEALCNMKKRGLLRLSLGEDAVILNFKGIRLHGFTSQKEKSKKLRAQFEIISKYHRADSKKIERLTGLKPEQHNKLKNLNANSQKLNFPGIDPDEFQNWKSNRRMTFLGMDSELFTELKKMAYEEGAVELAVRLQNEIVKTSDEGRLKLEYTLEAIRQNPTGHLGKMCMKKYSRLDKIEQRDLELWLGMTSKQMKSLLKNKFLLSNGQQAFDLFDHLGELVNASPHHVVALQSIFAEPKLETFSQFLRTSVEGGKLRNLELLASMEIESLDFTKKLASEPNTWLGQLMFNNFEQWCNMDLATMQKLEEKSISHNDTLKAIIKDKFSDFSWKESRAEVNQESENEAQLVVAKLNHKQVLSTLKAFASIDKHFRFITRTQFDKWRQLSHQQMKFLTSVVQGSLKIRGYNDNKPLSKEDNAKIKNYIYQNFDQWIGLTYDEMRNKVRAIVLDIPKLDELLSEAKAEKIVLPHENVRVISQILLSTHEDLKNLLARKGENGTEPYLRMSSFQLDVAKNAWDRKNTELKEFFQKNIARLDQIPKEYFHHRFLRKQHGTEEKTEAVMQKKSLLWKILNPKNSDLILRAYIERNKEFVAINSQFEDQQEILRMPSGELQDLVDRTASITILRKTIERKRNENIRNHPGYKPFKDYLPSLEKLYEMNSFQLKILNFAYRTNYKELENFIHENLKNDLDRISEGFVHERFDIPNDYELISEAPLESTPIHKRRQEKEEKWEPLIPKKPRQKPKKQEQHYSKKSGKINRLRFIGRKIDVPKKLKPTEESQEKKMDIIIEGYKYNKCNLFTDLVKEQFHVIPETDNDTLQELANRAVIVPAILDSNDNKLKDWLSANNNEFLYSFNSTQLRIIKHAFDTKNLPLLTFINKYRNRPESITESAVTSRFEIETEALRLENVVGVGTVQSLQLWGYQPNDISVHPTEQEKMEKPDKKLPIEEEEEKVEEQASEVSFRTDSPPLISENHPILQKERTIPENPDLTSKSTLLQNLRLNDEPPPNQDNPTTLTPQEIDSQESFSNPKLLEFQEKAELLTKIRRLTKNRLPGDMSNISSTNLLALKVALAARENKDKALIEYIDENMQTPPETIVENLTERFSSGSTKEYLANILNEDAQQEKTETTEETSLKISQGEGFEYDFSMPQTPLRIDSPSELLEESRHSSQPSPGLPELKSNLGDELENSRRSQTSSPGLQGSKGPKRSASPSSSSGSESLHGGSGSASRRRKHASRSLR